MEAAVLVALYIETGGCFAVSIGVFFVGFVGFWIVREFVVGEAVAVQVFGVDAVHHLSEGLEDFGDGLAFPEPGAGGDDTCEVLWVFFEEVVEDDLAAEAVAEEVVGDVGVVLFEGGEEVVDFFVEVGVGVQMAAGTF